MLISYLSARTITLPFKDVEELMLKSNDKIFVQPYSAQMDSFRYSSVLFTSITLFACVFYLLWEAMLISYLSSRTIILPFKTIDDLMQKTDLKIVVQPYSAQMDFFRYSTVPILQMAYAERIKPNLPFCVEYFQNAGEHFFS